jgi:hypothetical protein
MVDQIRLEGRALPIFPCRWDNKKPTCDGGFYAATTDPTEINRLWRERWGALTAVRMGEESGLAVLDIDPKGMAWMADFECTHGSDIFRTRCHATRRGGLHFVFRHRAGLRNSESKIALGIDVRGEGGYAVWWPANGGRVLSAAPVAPWPKVLDEALAEAEERHSNALRREQKASADVGDQRFTPISSSFPPPIPYEVNYAIKALSNACEELRACPADSHRRNKLLNILSYKMGRLIVRRWLWRPLAEESLLEACGANGLLEEDGKKQCEDSIASGIEAGMQVPYHDIRWRVMAKEN